MFKKYMHVERYSHTNPRTGGILEGRVYVFPKLDGSNHSVWYDKDREEVRCASRNMVLSKESDGTGFYKDWFEPNRVWIEKFVMEHPSWILYGEYMSKPHYIRGYKSDVWNKWHVFDVYDIEDDRWLSVDEYSDVLAIAGFTVLSQICVLDDPTPYILMTMAENDTSLIDIGHGEGIVIKNYDFMRENRAWAKFVREDFKAEGEKKVGDTGDVEYDIVSATMREDFVIKEVTKYQEEMGIVGEKISDNNTHMREIIRRATHEWWNDYSEEYVFMTKHTINMKTLKKLLSRAVVSHVMRMGL